MHVDPRLREGDEKKLRGRRDSSREKYGSSRGMPRLIAMQKNIVMLDLVEHLKESRLHGNDGKQKFKLRNAIYLRFFGTSRFHAMRDFLH